MNFMDNENKKIYFICDFFKEDYTGGAELTTDSLIQHAPSAFKIERVHSQNVTEEFLNNNINNLFIIGNFQNLNIKNKLFLIKNNKYSIIEYDYKFCKYRSIEKHKLIESIECNCTKSKENRINLLFYAHSDMVWFMSDRQRNVFLDKLDFLKKEKTKILSSVFSKKDLDFILKQDTSKKSGAYTILNSSSWIKGTKENIDFAKNNGLKFNLVAGLAYKEMIATLAQSKGLIFRPLGSDTCPRIVIEAKLLDCELLLNENVQHKNEEWFTNKSSCIEYLRANANFFWRYYKNV